MSRKYFGTDGVRGEVGQLPITPDFVMRLGLPRVLRWWRANICRRESIRRC